MIVNHLLSFLLALRNYVVLITTAEHHLIMDVSVGTCSVHKVHSFIYYRFNEFNGSKIFFCTGNEIQTVVVA